jgi:hypothetical protein
MKGKIFIGIMFLGIVLHAGACKNSGVSQDNCQKFTF